MILGRTNTAFEDCWYRPVASADSSRLAAVLTEAADGLGDRFVIDISSQPALWGGLLAGYRGSYLTRSSRDLEVAYDAAAAANLVEAHLIETLSSLGRPRLDFYVLRVRGPLRESIVEGVLGALESARDDGMVRFLGIEAEDEAATQTTWERHDAFEIALLGSGSLLEGFAAERRVGIVHPDDQATGTRILTVSSAHHVQQGALR